MSRIPWTESKIYGCCDQEMKALTKYHSRRLIRIKTYPSVIFKLRGDAWIAPFPLTWLGASVAQSKNMRIR
jgi:hypothetical protein